MNNQQEKEHDKLWAMRHTAEHVLTLAMLRLWPGKIKPAMGPPTEEGYYLDFDSDITISEHDFPKIEKEMAKIVKEKLPMIHGMMPPKEAREYFGNNAYKNNEYKHEWIDLIEERGEEVSIYWMGDKEKDLPATFADVCAGPHVATTGEVGAFKLTKIAGAYWHGDENNKMLQRIYGTAFFSKEDLKQYLHMLEEAKKRDHRKLGVELDLFTFSDLVGAGLPLWTPRGTLLRNLLDDFVWELRKKNGYEKVEIPHITKKDLYEKSGHWDKFKDELFRITTREGHVFAMKPMNCPHHTQIYDHLPRSYRDLPQRYANTTMVYRDEQSGELAGLSRVRCITQDDAHAFCRASQIEKEIDIVWNIVEEFYKGVGFEDLEITLSLHDPDNFKNYLGTPEEWKHNEDQLRAVVEKKGIEAKEYIGEAAFYGPKIDFKGKDSIGREWQIATIQLDTNLPERFDLNCVNEEGEKERIVMLHVAIMGSIERFMSIFIEHHAGAFPVWLCPVQVEVIPVGGDHMKFAGELADKLKSHDIRVEANLEAETVGKKIRKAAKEKIPYMLVVGDKEMESGNLAVRKRGEENNTEMSVDAFIEMLKKEITDKK